MKIKIRNEQNIDVEILEIRKLIKYILNQHSIAKAPVEISVLLVNNDMIRQLNQKYLNRSRPTDVICFRMWEGPFYKLHPELLGDIVVSVEKARYQASKLRRNFEDELYLYIIHGLLHLLGYEDNTQKNAKRMHKKSMTLLRKWRKIC